MLILRNILQLISLFILIFEPKASESLTLQVKSPFKKSNIFLLFNEENLNAIN